jgi:hypothetical protein
VTSTLPRKIYIPPLITQLSGTERLKLDREGNPYQYEMAPQTLDQSSDIAQERQARIAADQALLAQIIAETTARMAADIAETNARIAADTAETNARIAGDNNEANLRAAADNKLVPKNQLCTLWEQCDFSSLPTTDPGHGQPYLLGQYIVIGIPPPAPMIGLESGVVGDQWSTEDPGIGSGNWLWG